MFLLLLLLSKMKVRWMRKEKDKISAETAYNLVHKSLELFGCSPIKNVPSNKEKEDKQGDKCL